MNFLEYWLKGGLLMWPIGLCSILGLAIVLHRVVFFARARRQNDSALARLIPLVQGGRVHDAQAVADGMKGPVATVASALLGAWRLPPTDRDEIVTLAAERVMRDVEWGLRPLELIGRVAPLLGLLGTVTGLVQAFLVFSRVGSPDPALLADGIWQALLTTVAGLLVAIPAVIAYEWCESRADDVAFQMQAGVREIRRSRTE